MGSLLAAFIAALLIMGGTGIRSFEDYARELIARRRTSLGEDVVSYLIEAKGEADDPVLDEEELLHNVVNIAGAGADTTGNLLAFIVFMIVLLVASVMVGVICKRLAAGAVVFCAGAVVLFVLFQLRPAWLLTAFNAVLSALALFEPFKDIVGGMFSIPAIVYYLSVMGLFLFLTGQALARRRWN